MSALGEKARACLRMAALDPLDDARWALYREASARWSEKAVCRKFEELADRGYLEFGVSARTAWLTAKGRAALATPPPG